MFRRLVPAKIDIVPVLAAKIGRVKVDPGQVQQILMQPGKGTGLGLSTIYGIVTQSGGHFTVESTAGIGTIFRIYLPLVEAAAEEAKVIPPTPLEQSGTETILVVEDETALRRLLCMSLERCGYKVFAAKDGAEAIEVFQRHAEHIDAMISWCRIWMALSSKNGSRP